MAISQANGPSVSKKFFTSLPHRHSFEPRDHGSDIQRCSVHFRRHTLSIAQALRRADAGESSNVLPIVKIAIKQIKASMYFWIPNDKQAGFSGVPIHLMPHAEKAALKQPAYSPCSLNYNNYLSPWHG